MARESSTIVGSGINPLKRFVCINETTNEAHLRGTQVVLVNPEDGSAGRSGRASAQTVGSVAVKLPIEPLKYRRAISIYNNGSVPLYIGFSNAITTGNGWPIPPGVSQPMDVNGEIEVWGIAGSNIDIRILELS